APLLDEAGRGDGVLDAEGLEDLVGPGKLGLPDVKARELLALQEEHPATPPGECGRGGGPTRPAADDGGVEVPRARSGHEPGLNGVAPRLRARDRLLVPARAHGAVG